MNSTAINSDINFEIDISKIFEALLKRIKMIILFTAAFGISAFLISNFVITPKYIASVSMCITNNKSMASDSLDINDVNAGIALVPTYIELMQSYNILSEVAAKTQDLGYTVEDIASMISVSTVDETQIAVVSVVNTNPEHANIIANAIADIVPDRIVSFMEGTSIKVVDNSVLPEEPASPNVKKYTVFGLALGLFLGAALAVLMELLDRTVKSEGDLNSIYENIPVLGIIPEFNHSEDAEHTEENKW